MTYAFSYDVPGNRTMYNAVKAGIGTQPPEGLRATSSSRSTAACVTRWSGTANWNGRHSETRELPQPSAKCCKRPAFRSQPSRHRSSHSASSTYGSPQRYPNAPPLARQHPDCTRGWADHPGPGSAGRKPVSRFLRRAC
jgi:hypothetical protein